MDVRERTSKSFIPYDLAASLPGKIMLVSFVGIHIPLLAFIVYLWIEGQSIHSGVFWLLLISTLTGTAITIFILNRLLRPVKDVKEALLSYKQQQVLPNLEIPANHRSDDMAELIKATNEVLQELDRWLQVKNRLIAIISHDTKGALGSISMLHEFIVEEIESENPSKEEIMEYLDMIHIGAQELQEMVNNMILTARSDSDSISINKGYISPDQVFKLIRTDQKILTRSKNITLNLHSELNDSEKLYLDPDKFSSVLNNLLYNAIKFTREGGNIDLTLYREAECHVLSVADDGIGIPEKKQENLFEAFSSTEQGTSSESGTGLGLWITKTITELHGGNISFKSEEGSGTTFLVKIPAA